MTTKAEGMGKARPESIRAGTGGATSVGTVIILREFVSRACGASGFSTGTATFEPGAVLPCHRHNFSEAIIILRGAACAIVEGRSYRLEAFDCLHVPAQVAHEVRNLSEDSPLVALWAFASEEPSRHLVEPISAIIDRGLSNPNPSDPEAIVRFADAEVYELSEGAKFRDLFARRFGAVGICGGYGRFEPMASLPCHIHKYDESITIVEGEAVCLVQGNSYRLSGCDTAFIPEGRPHRFLNQSKSTMAMIWVYAGNEPERTLLDPAHCDGTLPWLGPNVKTS
jgi:quercetin dioxygenase-like cupin family protein